MIICFIWQAKLTDRAWLKRAEAILPHRKEGNLPNIPPQPKGRGLSTALPALILITETFLQSQAKRAWLNTITSEREPKFMTVTAILPSHLHTQEMGRLRALKQCLLTSQAVRN